ILAQLPERVQPLAGLDVTALPLADRWILSRAQATIREATASFEQFRLDEGAKRCFDFVWKELADWYVEAVKPRLAADTGAVLTYCFDAVLRLLHPVVPFITEELWQKLPGRQPDDLLAIAPWPTVPPTFPKLADDGTFARVQEAISKIRAIRAEYRVAPKTRLAAIIKPRSEAIRAAFDGERDTIVRLAQLSDLTLDGGLRGAGAHAVL